MKMVIVILALSAIALFSLSCDEAGDGGAFSYPHPDQATWTFSIDIKGTSTVAYQEVERWKLDGTYDHPEEGTFQCFNNYFYNYDTEQWEYNFTLHMLASSEGVSFYIDEWDGYVVFLNFPLEVGKEWWVSEEETAKVLAQENVTVPAGTFNNCYKIQYSENGEPYLNIWLPSGVGGMGVQMEYIGYQTEELSYYNLPS